MTKDTILIDVGLKSEGKIPISEFTRPGKSPEINVGDNYKVYIDKVDGRYAETILSREKAVKQAAWNKLQDAFTNGKTGAGIPFNRVKVGLSVDVNGVTAFLPGSQIDNKPIKNTIKRFR